MSCPRGHAPLAQLDRASGYGPEGRGFESLTAYHEKGHLLCRCPFSWTPRPVGPLRPSEFQYSGRLCRPSAKGFAFGENACTPQKRRRPEGRQPCLGTRRRTIEGAILFARRQRFLLVYLSSKSRHEKRIFVISPVRSCTEQGFCSSRQRQEDCDGRNGHRVPKGREYRRYGPNRSPDKVFLVPACLEKCARQRLKTTVFI